MKEPYVIFYLAGRDDRKIKNDIDTSQIAEDVIAGKGTIRDLVMKAVSEAAAPLRVDRKKKAWIDEYEDEIKDAGGDKELAYQHYLDGRIDELAHSLEADVVEDLDGMMGGDDGDEDAEDEDDAEK